MKRGIAMDYFFGLNASMSTFIVILFGYVAQIKLLYNGKKEAARGSVPYALQPFGLYAGILGFLRNLRISPNKLVYSIM